ncbi:MAG: rod-binding protein [Bacillota bacterium]
MDINNHYLPQQYQSTRLEQNRDLEQMRQLQESSPADNGDRLKQVVDEFTSILLKKMFKAMRETVPDEGLIDGGFAEDVFTDMHDQEISKLGARQNTFSDLNRVLYQQLKEKQGPGKGE